MNKFYLGCALMAMATSLTATATGPAKVSSKPGDILPAIEEICGNYDMEYTRYDWSGFDIVQVVCKPGEGENALVFSGFYENYDVKAQYDPTTGFVSFPNQQVDADGNVWFKCLYTDLFYDETTIVDGPYRAYMAQSGLLPGLMPESTAMNFGFFDKDDNMLLGCIDTCWFPLFDMSEDKWTPLPEQATYTDGWAAQAFDEEFPPYEVTVWQNNAIPTLIAIVDPYGPDTPFHEYNVDTEGKGFIILNVENPKCVRVLTRVYSGFTKTTTVEVGFGDLETYDMQYYNYNGEETFCFFYGRDPDSVAEIFIEQGMSVSNVSGRDILIKNCIFGNQRNRYADSAYSAGGGTALLSLNCDLPNVNYPEPEPEPEPDNAIDTIDVSQASAEYFNLQGMKIANPEHGQIYIERRGTSTRKVMM